jgi:hypothetical protein
VVGDGEGTVGETVVDVGGGVPPPLSGLSVGAVVPVTAVGDTVSVTTAVGVSVISIGVGLVGEGVKVGWNVKKGGNEISAPGVR